MMVKNEVDILGPVLEHLLAEEIENFYIADNMSIDGTRDILADYAGRYKNVHVMDDTEVGYYQERKMNRWIKEVVSGGAEIILPVDADEVWYSVDPELSLAQALSRMNADVAVAPVWDMVPQPTDDSTGNPLVDIVYREPQPELFPCVAYKYVQNSAIHQGNHNVTHPGTRDESIIAIRHFQYRSLEQMTSKFRNGKAAYDATNLSIGEGFHWRQGGAMTDEQLLAEWNKLVNQPGLVYDPAPVKGTCRP